MKRLLSQRGFTLVELLIVMGILGILLAALSSVLTSANRTYSTEANLIDVQDRIRGTMEFVVRALRNGVSSSVTITGTSPNQTLSLKVVEDVGRSTGSNSSTTINDTAKTTTWITNQWQNYYVQVSSGTGSGQGWKQISSNTDRQLTISSSWSPVPDNTSEYQISSANSFARSGNTLQYTKNGATSDLTANITEVTACGCSNCVPSCTCLSTPSNSLNCVNITLSAQTTNPRQDIGATSPWPVKLQSSVTLSN